MFAQQQTQQLVGSARTRVVSSRYVFHNEEHANEEREISLVLWILSLSNFKRGGAVDVDFGSHFSRVSGSTKWYPKVAFTAKRKTKTGNENASPLSSRSKERERENETFIPRSTRSNSCWRRLIFFLFFSPTASLWMDKIFVSFSQNTHKISLSLSNATI